MNKYFRAPHAKKYEDACFGYVINFVIYLLDFSGVILLGELIFLLNGNDF